MTANLTVLLRQLSDTGGDTRERVAEIIYPELKKIARKQFRGERVGHPLQPTALVHEAYVRLIAADGHTWQNRAHFFGAAAEIMRRILVDHARARSARKRGGESIAISLDHADNVGVHPADVELLDLDAALLELETQSPRQAHIVAMRYFAGLSIPDVAEALGITARTVDRDWSAARVWLRRRLRPV
jgi:RNA polymerase sigma factor (TIGR02999 family)